MMVHHEYQRCGFGKALLLEALESTAAQAIVAKCSVCDDTSATPSRPSHPSPPPLTPTPSQYAEPGGAFIFVVDLGGCEGASWPFFNRVLKMCPRRNAIGAVCHSVEPYECQTRDGGCRFQFGQVIHSAIYYVR